MPACALRRGGHVASTTVCPRNMEKERRERKTRYSLGLQEY